MTCPYPKTATLTLASSLKQGDLAAKLNFQRKEDDYCDYHFIVDGQKVAAHKAILAIASPYFDTMFKSQFVERYENTLDLSDVFSSAEDLDSIISYMYENKISISEENLPSILNGASHFLIEGLRANCAHYMVCNLGPQNVLRTWALAELYTLKDVIPICEVLVKARFHDYIVNHWSAMEVPKAFLAKMIEKGVMACSTVSLRAKFFIHWTKHDIKERGPQLVELMEAYSCILDMEISKSQLKSPQNVIKQLEKLESASARRNNSRIPPKLNRQRSTRSCRRCDIHVCLVKKRSAEDFFLAQGSIDLYGYVPYRNEWLNLGSINLALVHYKNIRSLQGFTKDSAAFLYEDFPKTIALGNLKTSAFDIVKGPMYATKAHETRSREERHYFCFDENVFCLLDQEVKYRKKPSRRSRVVSVATAAQAQRKTRFFFVRRVYVLQKGNTWKHLFDLPLNSDSTGESVTSCTFNTHAVGEELYILARVRTQNYASYFSPFEYRTALLVIRKHKAAYSVTQLKAPPSEIEIREETVKMAGDDEGNLTVTLESRYNRRTVKVLMYDKTRDCWKDCRIEPVGTLEAEAGPLQHFKQKTFYSRANPNNPYAIDLPCPFVSRLWHGYRFLEPSGGTSVGWTNLPGPPTLHVYEFLSTSVSWGFLDRYESAALFDDYSLHSELSPFYTAVRNGSCLHPDENDTWQGFMWARKPYTFASHSDSSSSDRYSVDDVLQYGLDEEEEDEDDDDSLLSSGGDSYDYDQFHF